MEWSKRSTGRKSHSLRQQNEGHQLHRSAFLNEWMTLFRSKNWSNIEKTNKTKSKKKQVEVHPLLTFPLLPHILFQQKGIGWISVSCVELHFGPDKAKGKVTEIHHQECVASKTIVLQWNMCRMCAPLLAARCIFFFFLMCSTLQRQGESHHISHYSHMKAGPACSSPSQTLQDVFLQNVLYPWRLKRPHLQ